MEKIIMLKACVAVICIYEGPSWSWLYGSWIYNYLCDQYVPITTNVV